MSHRMTLAALTLILAGASLAAAAENARHTVYSMYREETGDGGHKTLLYSDTVRTVSSDPLPVGDYYAINEPSPAGRDAAKPDTGNKTAWYWIGGSAAAVVAGVTAWVLISDDQPSQPKTFAVMP